MRDIVIKQGFNRPIPLDVENEDGSPFDFSDVVQIRAKIRNISREIVAELNITVDQETPGRLIIETGPTDDWKVGDHVWDVYFYLNNGDVFPMPEKGVCKWTVDERIS